MSEIKVNHKELIRKARLGIFKENYTHKLHCPNTTTVFWWEVDMLTVTKSNITHEFEIKLNKADFRADFKKSKHDILADSFKGAIPIQRAPDYLVRAYTEKGDPVPSHIAKVEPVTEIPNYFWFVTIGFELSPDELPEYAGYIKMWEPDYPLPDSGLHRRTIKQAPRIHRGKLNPKQIERLTRAINARYWKWAEEAYPHA